LVLDGHEKAFEVLFERHVADSLWYAREVLGTWAEAEEAVRHSFAAAHAYLETRGRETEFGPWLHTILGNHCLSMLQARTPGPRRLADDSVVDLGEWRLRRKLLGIALPIPASAGLRESVMAACGIGGGAAAATASAPLLGGTLAKLAVVAVLAGGVGLAGDVSSSDRAESASAGPGARAMVTPSGGAASEPSAGADRVQEPLGGVGRVTDVKVRKRQVTATPVPREPSERAPSRRVSSVPTPASAGPGSPTEPARVPATPVELEAKSVTKALSRSAIEGRAESQPLVPAGLSEVTDRLQAVVGEPAADVRALLRRVARPAPE